MSDLKGNYPIVLEQNVIWGDMDAFEHVNNTVYFRYFEDARMAYFEKIGAIDYKNETQIGPILANTRCDFKLPLSYPDRVQIAATIEDMKDKRFTMKYVVYSETLESIVAEGEGLIVYYDYQQGRSCAIPPVLVTAIKNLEEHAC